MKLRIRALLLLPAVFTLCWGCVSLKHVNEFSAASGRGIAAYSDLPYSYGQYCLDACKLDREKQIISGKVPFNPNVPLNCDCRADKARDADAARAYTALLLYFSGLEKLSSGDKFVYKTADLTAALAKVKAISDPNLAAPATKIADIILNMATNAYRSHALEKILSGSQQPVDALLEDLVTNNTILKGRDQAQYGKLLALIASGYAGAQPVDPRGQLNDFWVLTAAFGQVKQTDDELSDFNGVLEKIRQGHNRLAAERLTLKNKDLIEYLFTQAGQLKTNISKL